MGFKTSVRTYTVQFAEGHEFHGAEARVKGMSFGEYIAATGLDGSDGDGSGGSLRNFATHLVSWNREDENWQPIPPTKEGINQVDHDLIVAISNAWIQTLLGVHDADPLPEHPSFASSPSRRAGRWSVAADADRQCMVPAAAIRGRRATCRPRGHT